MSELIIRALKSLETTSPTFPATLIYNEGWLLRLVLAALKEAVVTKPFGFHPSARWFSEAQLRSAFLSRPASASNGLAESHTRADGVVGHFRFNAKTRSEVELTDGVTQFLICEAKLFSLLTAGVKKAVGYDQAARTVACMAETVARAFPQGGWEGISLGFYLLAPNEQIVRGVFNDEMNGESIESKISARIEAYKGLDDSRYAELSRWRNEYVRPLLERLDIRCIAWEDMIATLHAVDPEGCASVRGFYGRCLTENRPAVSPGVVGRQPMNGQVFEIETDGGRARVRVIRVGSRNSRVIPLDQAGASFCVANVHFQNPLEWAQQAIVWRPTKGQPCIWTDSDGVPRRVVVRNVGPARSRVWLEENTKDSTFKVPNHTLLPIDRE